MKTFIKVATMVLVFSFVGLGLSKVSLADNPAHLNVINTVVGGTAASSDFSVTVTGASANPGTFSGSTNGTDVQLTPLTNYQVSVSPVANYTTTFSDNCSGTSINEFHPLTCTITNTFVPPAPVNPAHLTVIKHVVGGTAVASDFTITVTGASALPSSFQGSETGTDVTLTPSSTYSVTEGTHDGYTATYSDGCNGTSINEFHPSTCTITNTFNVTPTPTVNPAHLTVIKHVVGGTAVASDFTISVTGGSAIPASFPGSESGTDVTLTPASLYTVTEGAHTGYTATYSSGCNGTSINEFHPSACTITNTFSTIPPANPAHLTVIKHVVGGTAVASDFTISVTGASALPASFPGSETGTDVALTPFSTYTVTEGAHDGYTATYSDGCTGTSINEFHPSACTITNTFNTNGGGGTTPNPAHLTVIKHVVGGTAVASDFTITVTGASALPSSFQGSETGTDVTLTPSSTYSVTEGTHDGYTATYSDGCNGTSINEFHPSTCTITNTFNVTPVDVCPNIDGIQETVPSGQHKDNDGNCVNDTNGGGGGSSAITSGGGGGSAGAHWFIPPVTGEVLGAEAPTPEVLGADIGLPRTDGGNIPMYLIILSISGMLTLVSLAYLSVRSRFLV